ncbi:MAG: hypothetical protein LBN27_01725 [Prevotellaceae bacterium]|nr:hypothetical protein [Prevotellaceae bacterium]
MSCKSTKVATTETNNTEHFREVTKKVTDSVFVYRHDSVLMKIKNDTVFYDRWHTFYSTRIKTDTLIKTDTVKIEARKTETKTVEVNRLTPWQDIRLKALNWLIAAILLYGVYRAIKWYLKKQIPII